MERVIGQYIRTIGADLVLQQGLEDQLALTKSDIEWLIQQGAKDTSTLLHDDGVPQEDLAPSLFLPDLQATPAPIAPLLLQLSTPNSPLTTLMPSSIQVSPSISAIATPLAKTFDQLSEQVDTPEASAMDISPPTHGAVSLDAPLISTPISSQTTPMPVIQQVSNDQQMTDAQRMRIDEVLKEYQDQELRALQELQNT